MAHQLSPENARRFWNAWKKLKLSEGKQRAFTLRTPRTTPRAPSKITPIVTPQGTIVYDVNGPGPNNYNRKISLIGRNDRIHYYELLNQLIKKYHVPVKFMKHNIGENWVKSLKPIYGFGGLTNRVKRARQKRKEELANSHRTQYHANLLRNYLRGFKLGSNTQVAERMVQNRLAEKLRNIERKITEVRKAPNGPAKNNARRNARYAINSFFGLSSNSNAKKKYLENLNEA